MFRRFTIADLILYTSLVALALGVMTQTYIGEMVYEAISITFNGPEFPK